MLAWNVTLCKFTIKLFCILGADFFFFFFSTQFWAFLPLMCFGSVYFYILYCCSVPHTLTFKALTIKCDPHLGSSTENHCLKWNALQTVPLGFNMTGETSCPLTRWFKAAPLMSRLLSVKLSQCKCRVSIISQSSVEMLPLHFLISSCEPHPPLFFPPRWL